MDEEPCTRRAASVQRGGMEADPTTSPDAVAAARPDWISVVSAIAGTLMIVLAGAALLFQIEVTEAAVTRSCGSAFDSVADRSGWDLWWARDLDESEEVRSALVRTTRCPDAVNQRLAVAAALGFIGLVLGGVAIARRRAARPSDATASSIGGRIVRIGRLTSALGGVLTVVGLAAILFLVADADSTLFLYTDRLVVAVVGLIVLIPTITLFVIGRVLVLLGENIQQSDRDRFDG
jgi:hypothetical protein